VGFNADIGRGSRVFSDAEIDAIVHYIRSLRPEPG